jgi:ribosomal RNA-processing protein 12
MAASNDDEENTTNSRAKSNEKKNTVLIGFPIDDPIQELFDKHARSNQPESRRVVQVLESMREVILEQNVQCSSVSVFAATMAALRASTAQNDANEGRNDDDMIIEQQERRGQEQPTTTVHAMLTVLSVAIEHTSTKAIRMKLKEVLRALVHIGKQNQEHSGCLRAVLKCMGFALRASKLITSKEEYDLFTTNENNTNNTNNDAMKAFSALCHFCVDARPKVRKSAHEAVHCVLQETNGTKVGKQFFQKIFGAFACDKMSKPGEAAEKASMMKGAKGAKKEKDVAIATAAEALHVLGALKQSLASIEEPTARKIIEATIELTTLGEPMLETQATETLLQLSISPNTSCDAKSLLKILEPMAILAREATQTQPTKCVTLARLIANVVVQMYRKDPEEARKALPFTFESLLKLLNAPHEGVAIESCEAMKMLIRETVDSEMAREGVKYIATIRVQAKENKKKKNEPLKPPPMISLANTIESALGMRYRAAWPFTVPVATQCFQRLGVAGGALLTGALAALGEMGANADGLRCKAQIETCISTAAEYIGAEALLEQLPLQLEESINKSLERRGDDDNVQDEEDMHIDDESDGSRLWLVPLLRRSLTGARMSFFGETVLPEARRLGGRAAKAQNESRLFEAQRCRAAELALWSLLPGFANFPTDAGESFPSFAKDLGQALSAREDLRAPICECLRRLCRQALLATGEDDDEDNDDEDNEINSDLDVSDLDTEKEENEDDDLNKEKVPAQFTVQIAEAQLEQLSRFSKNFMPILFNLFVTSEPHARGEISSTIGAFAKIASKETVNTFFKQVLKKLVEAATISTDDENSKQKKKSAKEEEEQRIAKKCSFIDLAHALVPGLDLEALDAAFKIASSAANEKEAATQKRAYKLLSAICAAKKGSWLAKMSKEVETCLMDAGDVCVTAARRRRLEVIGYVLPYLQSHENVATVASDDNDDDENENEANDDAIKSLLAELILATKEQNAKTRLLAYQLLVDIPRRMEKEASERHGAIADKQVGNRAGVAAWLAQSNEDENVKKKNKKKKGDDESGDFSDDDEDVILSDDDNNDDNDDDDNNNMAVENLALNLSAVPELMDESSRAIRGFFLTVLAGVVGATPQMQSASVVALARLLYEFSAKLIEIVPELLPAIYKLLKGKNREVVKASLGFIKVVAVRLPQNELAMHLPELLPAVLKWSSDSKNRFKLKTKVIVERCAKRCGWRAVEDAMPKEHLALALHMKKEETKMETKKKKARADETASRASGKTGRKSRWNEEEIFGDGENDGEKNDRRVGGGGRSDYGGGGFGPKSHRNNSGGSEMGFRNVRDAHASRSSAGARLPVGAEFDLLDDSKMRKQLLAQGAKTAYNRRNEFGDNDDDGSKYRTDKQTGKLKIVEENDRKRGRDDDDENADDANADDRATNRTFNTRKTNNSNKRGAGTSKSFGTNKSTKTNKTSKTALTHTGDRYKAKGGGDVRKKGEKLQPYAYWPLDAKLLNRRNSKRGEARETLSGVVKGSAVLRGKKARRS